MVNESFGQPYYLSTKDPGGYMRQCICIDAEVGFHKPARHLMQRAVSLLFNPKCRTRRLRGWGKGTDIFYVSSVPDRRMCLVPKNPRR